MSLHLDTLSWLRANQFLLFLRNAVCLVEKQQITNFIVFGLTRSGIEPTIYCTRGEHAYHYTTDMVLFFLDALNNFECIWIFMYN